MMAQLLCTFRAKKLCKYLYISIVIEPGRRESRIENQNLKTVSCVRNPITRFTEYWIISSNCDKNMTLIIRM